MRTAKLVLTTDDKQIEYLFDLENQTYRSSSSSVVDGVSTIEDISEEGSLGDAAKRQTMAKRIYYILVEILKPG